MTRLHDEKGNRVAWKRLLRNGSRAYLTGLGRLFLGFRPSVPWISYDAIKLLEATLDPASRVIEFGSGMSTLWYARHAGFVYSIENCELWYRKTAGMLEKHGIRNVRYRYASSRAEYITPPGMADTKYDLIMVDGDYRSECIRNALPLLCETGVLYLDNSDKDSRDSGGDLRLAEDLALDFARRTNSTVTYFTDFAPTQFTPNQGLMVTCGGKADATTLI